MLEGSITTKIQNIWDRLDNWAQNCSLWVSSPIGSGSSQLAYLSSFVISEGLGSLGVEFENYPPQESDLLLINGVVTEKQLPWIIQAYEDMVGPRWVVVLGESKYSSYNIVKDINEYVPVDVYVPGNHPTAEDIIEGFLSIKKLIEEGGRGAKNCH